MVVTTPHRDSFFFNEFIRVKWWIFPTFFVPLCSVYIYCMRRTIITLAAVLFMAMSPTEIVAQMPDIESQYTAVEEMLERRRWGDAHVALKELTTKLDPIKHKREMEWCEYQLLRCVVELDMDNVEKSMDSYLRRYPTSIYKNSVAFMVAGYVCDNGDMKRAKELFESVDYKSLDAREKERYNIRVGYIRFLDKEYDQADELFERIHRYSEYCPHALYFSSYIDYIEGRNDEAEKGFKRLMEYAEYADLAPYYLLQLEYREGDYNNVIEKGEKLLSKASEDIYADLVRIIAESYFINGDYANALRYISNYPDEMVGRQENYIKGYSLYRLARYQDAIPSLTAVCGAEDALTQNASYHLGDCYLRVKDKHHAADAFAMASVEGFDDDIAEDALLNYGRLRFELGGGVFNEAINVLHAYLERYPNSEYTAEVKKLLVAAFYNSADYAAAYNTIKQMANPDRELRAVLQRVAVYCAVEAIGRGEWESAEKLLKESEQIDLVPKYNALTLYWLGEVAYHKGELEQAVAYYEGYMRRAPKDAVEYHYANYGLGYVFLSLGKMDRAQSAFKGFVRDYTLRDGYLYDAHNRLGDAHFAVREFKEARNAYNVVANTSAEERHYANYQLALVDGIDNNMSSKIERLKGIVAGDEGPYIDDAWYELGRSYITLERYREGAETLSNFVDSDTLSPYRTAALSDLALAYYNLGRKGDARLCYERVVSLDPQSPAAMEAIRGIREIYLAEGRVDDYLAYAERNGLQGDMSAAARDSLTFASAKSLYLNGDMREASRKLTSYVDSFPNGYNRTEALFLLSDSYVSLEDNESALRTMKQLLDYGTTQYTERVLDVYARMNFNMEYYDESAKAYRQLYDVSREAKRREVAAEGYVEATLKCGSGEDIKLMAADVLKMKDATEWAVSQAKLAKANVLREEGSRKEAMQIYAELAKNRKQAEGAEAYYRLVEDDYLLGNYERAEKRVYDLGECGSIYWQAKIFLILGDVLVEKGNKFQARATYQSIVDGYTPSDDGIVEEARQRIASLAE